MSKPGVGLLSLLALIPLAANGQVGSGDLPDDTVWYLHANLAAIRSSDGGKPVWSWFEDEVVEDVKDDVGIDIGAEVDSVTAFANSSDGTIIIVEGPMSRESRDKMLALAARQGPVDPREYDGKTYYFFGDEDDIDDPADEPFEDLEDALFLSFAIKGKALIAGTEAQMRDLLDNGGRVTGKGSHDGALLVLSANNTLVQAGMQKEGLIDEGDDDDDWESKIVRNTEQGALLLADASGQLAIEARLVSTDPKMAEAIGGIVNGLIALQAFNSDLGPEIQSLMQNTKVEVLDNNLSINMVIDPDLVVSILDD
jgi:hypothetical protein